MLLEAEAQAAMQAGGITSFVFIILIWTLAIGIPIILLYFLIKKVIKPMLNYFKTKQDYYAAQTEYLKNEKDKG